MNPNTAIILLSCVAGGLLVVAGLLLLGRRQSPQQRERARRLHLTARGRLVEAEITDVEAGVIAFTYEVAGVTYHCSQDVAAFGNLPSDPMLLLGPAAIKYSPANPANSILMSEEWSGIRVARPPSLSKSKGA